MASSLKEAQRYLLETHPYYIESGETFESLSSQEEEEAISAMVREAGIFEIKVSFQNINKNDRVFTRLFRSEESSSVGVKKLLRSPLRIAPIIDHTIITNGNSKVFPHRDKINR